MRTDCAIFAILLACRAISLSCGAQLSSAAQTMVYFHLDTHVLLHRGVTAGAADHRGNPATPAHSPATGVQLPVGLHLHNRGRLLELRRRRRLWRRHPERAADQLLRARHLPDSQSRPYRPIRCLRAARDRPHLFCPPVRDGRPGALRRSDRAVGVLALQWRACALDPAQLLPDRLAAARGLCTSTVSPTPFSTEPWRGKWPIRFTSALA